MGTSIHGRNLLTVAGITMAIAGRPSYMAPIDIAQGFKAPRIRAAGYTVAQGKRDARKARNAKRHKAAVRRAR
jgi:hypothetical protein